MPSTTAEQKKQLRKSVRSLLTALSPEERTAGDRAMFQAFLSLPEVRQTGTFFLFWGIAGLEPDTGSLAASLNSMLTRIESSFHEQEETTDKMKRFVSDASHELRTPGSPRLRDGVPGLPPGAAHGHLRLRHPGAHGAGPSNPP